MFRKLLLAGAFAGAVFASSSAAAAVIDFNGLTTADGYSYVYGPYKEDGYTLASSSCASTKSGPLCFNSVQAFKDIDPVGASVVNYHGGAVLTLTADDASPFLLQSIDLSEYWDDLTYGPGAMSALFTFNLADGSSQSETFTFNTRGRYPVTTLDFDLGPLKSFSFKPTANTSGFLQFDNIVLASVSAVPEPATWAMMILGFFGVGGALRVTRRRTAFA
jgi:hypothetical protein